MCSGRGSVRELDHNAPKVGMRPRVGILDRQRRQGELSQASIEVVHVEILMVAKTPGGPIKSVRLSLVLQRIQQGPQLSKD